MVRGAGPPMKVAHIGTDGMAECIFVDSNGDIRHRFHHVDNLTPMWLSLQPRSAWPEITQLDQIANQREERLALQAKEAERRASKKSKRSNKIKRRVPA
jgi:uncharacterized protein YodC (DUF2158 family)